MPGNLAELGKLLSTLFDPTELRQFLSRLPDGQDFEDALLVGEVSKANLFRSAVQALGRRGMVDAEFFAALKRERPKRQAEIEEVEFHLISLRSSPHSTSKHGTDSGATGAPVNPSVAEDGTVKAVGVVCVNGKPNRTGFVAGPGGLVLTAGHLPEQLKGTLTFALYGAPGKSYPVKKLERLNLDAPGVDAALIELAEWDDAADPLTCTPHQCGVDYYTFAWIDAKSVHWIPASGKVDAMVEGMLSLTTDRQYEGMSGCPILQGEFVVGIGAGRFEGKLASARMARATPLERLPPDLQLRLRWTPSGAFRRTNSAAMGHTHTALLTPANDNWIMAHVVRDGTRRFILKALALGRLSIAKGKVYKEANGQIPSLNLADHLRRSLDLSPNRDHLRRNHQAQSWKDYVLLLEVDREHVLHPFERERLDGGQGTTLHRNFHCVAVLPRPGTPNKAPDHFNVMESVSIPRNVATLRDEMSQDELADACNDVACLVAGPQVPHEAAVRAFNNLTAAVLHEDPDQDHIIGNIFPDGQPVPPMTLLGNVSTLRRSSDRRVIVLWSEPDLYMDEDLYLTA